MPTFTDWLRRARVTDDPAGDFVSDARDDSRFPEHVGSLDDLRGYLLSRSACPEALSAANTAWRRYRGWRRTP